MARVFVGIGSNIERERNVRSALTALSPHYALTISSVYESEALSFDGGNFYNLVVGFNTGDDVLTIAHLLRAIEDRHGRVRDDSKIFSRTLDLDLLTYGNLVTSGQGPTLPRPEILEHAFVLCPLAEIAGELRHPVNGRCYGELWKDFHKEGQALWRVANRGWLDAHAAAKSPCSS